MIKEKFKPEAFITLSNLGGIEIMINDSVDGVYYRFNYGQDNLEDEPILEAEILYSHELDREGEPYFIHNTGKEPVSTYSVYYLSEAMKHY
jgi:hypothetical protein